MKCVEFRDLVFDYLGGTLPDRRAFEEHFAGCAGCAALLRGIESNEEVLSRAGAPEAPPDLWPRIARAISAGREVRFGPPRRAAAMAAAAAAVLVALSLVFAAVPAPPPELDVVVLDAGPALKALVPRYEDADTAVAWAGAPGAFLPNDY